MIDTSPHLIDYTILVVDDDDRKRADIEACVRGAGFNPIGASDSDSALDVLESTVVGITIVDGDLGDGNFGHGGIAARLIDMAFSAGLRYLRCSSAPDEIPSDLHGESCFRADDDGLRSLSDWLVAHKPEDV